MSQKILIVDDEKSVRHMLRRMLGSHGFEIEEADSGLSGLDRAQETAPDLVITDLKMPKMDGLEMAQKMLQENPDRPVLLMTAYADLESARKAVRIGIYDYFLKPIDLHDLMATINRALERHRLVLENAAYQKDLEQKVLDRTQELALKVEDLEARDHLLTHLLSIQEPTQTIGLAVQLACQLCRSDFGALYIEDDSEFHLRAAYGFQADERVCDPEALTDIALVEIDQTKRMLEKVKHAQGPLIFEEIDGVREGFGFASLGGLPVLKADQCLAVLEVGRRKSKPALTQGDLQRLTSFIPYVAMAVADCLLQDALPDWERGVDEVLSESDKWMK